MQLKRTAWLSAALVIGATAGVAFALYAIPGHGSWTKSPSITVVSADPADPRLPVVDEAVDFWNRMFAQLGTPFRLGPVARMVGRPPDADLQALSAQTLEGKWFRSRPGSLDRFPGDLIIVLSDANFISFSAPLGDRALVAIKSERQFPLTLPNVLRNVIAHELGHAVGLGHNADPAMLMCGRPADCRPQDFESATARFFPLTEPERARLKRLYPPDWHGER